MLNNLLTQNSLEIQLYEMVGRALLQGCIEVFDKVDNCSWN